MNISQRLTVDQSEKYNKELFKNEDILKNLIKAINEQTLVIFWGAGVSRLGGCQDWDGLARRLINCLTNEKIFNYSEKKKLNELCLYNLRKVITMCYNRASNCDKLDLYYKSIEDSVTPSKEDLSKFKMIHNSLLLLEPLFYITTNIDEGMSSILEKNSTKTIIDLADTDSLEKLKLEKNYQGSVDQMILSLMNSENVFYLHGTKSSIRNSIFRDDNYYEFYERPDIRRFLNNLFEDYTILFIGYSLSEQEILSNLFLSLKKNNKLGPKEAPIHYSLIPILSSDISNLNLEEEYLNMFKIQPLFYYIDYEDYQVLFDILNYLKQFIFTIRKPLDILKAFKKN